jgi:hypothetical protein
MHAQLLLANDKDLPFDTQELVEVQRFRAKSVLQVDPSKIGPSGGWLLPGAAHVCLCTSSSSSCVCVYVKHKKTCKAFNRLKSVHKPAKLAKLGALLNFSELTWFWGRLMWQTT